MQKTPSIEFRWDQSRATSCSTCDCDDDEDDCDDGDGVGDDDDVDDGDDGGDGWDQSSHIMLYMLMSKSVGVLEGRTKLLDNSQIPSNQNSPPLQI